jgi:hypothetical protein
VWAVLLAFRFRLSRPRPMEVIICLRPKSRLAVNQPSALLLEVASGGISIEEGSRSAASPRRHGDNAANCQVGYEHVQEVRYKHGGETM